MLDEAQCLITLFAACIRLHSTCSEFIGVADCLPSVLLIFYSFLAASLIHASQLHVQKRLAIIVVVVVA